MFAVSVIVIFFTIYAGLSAFSAELSIELTPMAKLSIDALLTTVIAGAFSWLGLFSKERI